MAHTAWVAQRYQSRAHMAPSALRATARLRHVRLARALPATLATPPRRLAARALEERAYPATAAWAALAALTLLLAARRAASPPGAQFPATAQRAWLVVSAASALPGPFAGSETLARMVPYPLVRHRALCTPAPYSTALRASVVQLAVCHAQISVSLILTFSLRAIHVRFLLKVFMLICLILTILEDVPQAHSVPQALRLVPHVCVLPATCPLNLVPRIVQVLMGAVAYARRATTARAAAYWHRPARALWDTRRRPWAARTAPARRALVRRVRQQATVPAATRSRPARRHRCQRLTPARARAHRLPSHPPVRRL